MDDELRAHLYELEKRLTQTAEPGSAAAYDELLANDFVEIGRSGRVYKKEQIIKELANRRPEHIAIAGFHARQLTADLALVTYRSHVAAVSAQVARHALRCSIWRRTNDTWQMIFHQGTPTEPE